MIEIIQTNINIASTLCINLPYSKFRVSTYKEKDSSLCIVNESDSKRHVTLKNKYKADIITATIDILFSFSGLSSNGGKNNKYNIPEKLNILLRPEKNVLSIPYPKIGNIRSGIKFFIDDARITIMQKNMIGAIIRFAFAITLSEDLLLIILLAIKNSVINNIGDVLK